MEIERKQTPYSGLFCSLVTSRLQINPANWFVPRQGYQMTEERRERSGGGEEDNVRAVAKERGWRKGRVVDV